MADQGAFPVGWQAFDDRGFVAHVGPVYHRTVDGRRDFAFRAEDKHANLIGIVMGGMLVTFADRALGICAIEAAGGANCVTVQLDTQFIGAGRIGELIETTPEVVTRSASMVFLRAVVTSGERTLCAVSGIWKILRDKGESGDGDKSSDGNGGGAG